MQYLLLIHQGTKSAPSSDEWTAYFARAEASSMFRGGSELGKREVIGDTSSVSSTAHIVGFMRFDADDKTALLDLLQHHPVVAHGGAVELCEMPES